MKPNHPLTAFIECAVPLNIAAIKAEGGPTDADLAEARAFADVLARRGDTLLFGGGKPGEAGELATQTARAIAVLAFCPGGVRLFGQHWTAERQPSTYYTPPELLRVIDPATGSGGFLAGLISNPPWGAS